MGKVNAEVLLANDVAVVPENGPLSTNGAVAGAGRCHSVRVIFQGQAVSEPGEILKRTETPSKTPRAGLVRQPKLQESLKKFKKSRWRA